VNCRTEAGTLIASVISRPEAEAKSEPSMSAGAGRFPRLNIPGQGKRGMCGEKSPKIQQAHPQHPLFCVALLIDKGLLVTCVRDKCCTMEIRHIHWQTSCVSAAFFQTAFFQMKRR
jgi:hypothetical protein